MSEIDEMDGVRRLLAEPPAPSPEAAAKAFGLLEREMSGGRRAGTARAGRRLRYGWPFGLGAGLAAVGAAAAVTVVVTGQGTPEPGKTAPGVDLNRQAVLAAAGKAALMPTGKYWYTDQIQGQSYMMRPKTGEYAIVGAHSETFEWSGAKSGMGEAFYGRDIPARPLTPKDAALWRKAGAPSAFRVWSNDHYYTYDRKTSAWEADRPDAKGGGRWLGDRDPDGGESGGLTVDDLQNLPTDPASLAARFLKGAASDPKLERIRKTLAQMQQQPVPADPGKRAEHAAAIKSLQDMLKKVDEGRREDPHGSREKLMRAEDLMMDLPLPPAVRAGLMRALAAQPGVRAIGAVTDELGRKGIALAAADTTVHVTGEYGTPAAEQGTYTSHEEIMFDPATGQLLGSRDVLTRPGGAYRSQAPGFVINYWLVRSSGWTDAKPEPPAKLPF
ncbi:hypothetical protein GCM10009527_089810 [Actinomadura nitritigenes]|uniref:CU044_5270 family protein n=1 Tax=Actinomadura nitritigenes TaxID=134602 RepID=A0ABS3REC5_9ACTN|nr:hypothetical protein [Actinomadura nitritigenes]MBO2444392.1 hypothetical protein [Actinomadura nitritigenes]